MYPTYYACSRCQEKFQFQFRDAMYYVGPAPAVGQVGFDDLLSVNLRPGWCRDCECLCVVEDILPVRAFEDAYGAARSGRQVDYPALTFYRDASEPVKEVGNYLRWRMARIHPARALCCGRSLYQLMDVAQPILKHDGCEYGFIEPWYQVSGYNGPGPGVGRPANIRLFDAEGILIGQLTWRNDDERMWDIEPLQYPPPVVDD